MLKNFVLYDELIILPHKKPKIYNMPYLFTSESVSEGHPDKVADQISDALIDNFLAFDPQSKVACETLGNHRTGSACR